MLSFFLANVKEHATPLAGASVETGVKVHTKGDVADRAASGGCCVSTCCASYVDAKKDAMMEMASFSSLVLSSAKSFNSLPR